jgi:hypothetical protein
VNPSHVTQAGFIIKPSSDGVLAHGDWAVSLLVSTKLTADRCIFYIPVSFYHHRTLLNARAAEVKRGLLGRRKRPTRSNLSLACCV